MSACSSRRTLLGWSLALVGLLSGCGGTQTETKELNLYAWSEYIPKEMLTHFTEQTGIKVNYDTFASNEEMLAKLQAGTTGYDLVIVSDYTVAILKNQNQLETLDKSQLPNLIHIDDQLKNLDYDPGNQFTVPYQWGTVGLAINTDKVKTPITRWADLWNPRFKEKIVLLDDEFEVLGMVLQTLGFDKNTRDPKQLEAAKVKFATLRPNIKLFDSDSPKSALLSGEVVIGMVWNGEAALARRENPKITYICPQEGCGIWYDNWGIPKSAPHKDAALAFINYSLTPEAGMLITREFPYSNPNKAALELLKTKDPKAYRTYMDFPSTNPPPAFVKAAKPVNDKGDATPLWDRVWTEIKSSF